jgi:squalene-associated FAD-dependent desaturase
VPDNIIILGGGFAGLSAAVSLAESGYGVRLLEQRPYLGGRARSFLHSASGAVVDNGQHIFMGCYQHALRFLTTIGTLHRIQFQNRLEVHFLEGDGRHTWLRCPGLPAPWHLLSGALTSNSFGAAEKLQILRMGRVVQQMPVESPAPGLANITVRQWLRQCGQSDSVQSKFWDLLCIAALNEDPAIAAAALFARVLRLALFRSPADSRIGLAAGGLSECYTGAAQAFVEARGGAVTLGANVTGLVFHSQGKGGESVGGQPARPEDAAITGVRLQDGSVLPASLVISALPCWQLAPLLPAPWMQPGGFFAGTASLRPVPIISIYLWFDQPITDLPFVGLRGRTIQWLFNKGDSANGLGGASRAHLVSLVISGAHQWIGVENATLLQIALEDLRALLPRARRARLLDRLIIKERLATFSPAPGTEDSRPAAQTPVRGFYLAGDWTATGLPATIESAVKSGYTAASCLMQHG